VFNKTGGMTHLYKKKEKKIVLLVSLKISYFSQLNRKSNLGNYLMPYKEEEKKFVALSFCFAVGVLKLSIINI
jgi:hypothetical protein